MVMKLSRTHKVTAVLGFGALCAAAAVIATAGGHSAEQSPVRFEQAGASVAASTTPATTQPAKPSRVAHKHAAGASTAAATVPAVQAPADAAAVASPQQHKAATVTDPTPADTTVPADPTTAPAPTKAPQVTDPASEGPNGGPLPSMAPSSPPPTTATPPRDSPHPTATATTSGN